MKKLRVLALAALVVASTGFAADEAAEQKAGIVKTVTDFCINSWNSISGFGSDWVVAPVSNGLDKVGNTLSPYVGETVTNFVSDHATAAKVTTTVVGVAGVLYGAKLAYSKWIASSDNN